MPRICPLLSCGKTETKDCTNDCRFFKQAPYDKEDICMLLKLVDATQSIAADLDHKNLEEQT